MQDAQKLDLHVHGQIADFVQKQGATVRQLESAQTVGHGTGVGDFAMTEKFAFDQIARDGPAVDGHKRTAGAGALGMQGLGHQFFARAAFASHQGSRR